MYRIKENWTLKSYSTVLRGNFTNSLDFHEEPLQYLIEFLNEQAYELKAYNVKYNAIEKLTEIAISVVPAGKGDDAIEIDAALVGKIVFEVINRCRKRAANIHEAQDGSNNESNAQK